LPYLHRGRAVIGRALPLRSRRLQRGFDVAPARAVETASVQEERWRTRDAEFVRLRGRVLGDLASLLGIGQALHSLIAAHSARGEEVEQPADLGDTLESLSLRRLERSRHRCLILLVSVDDRVQIDPGILRPRMKSGWLATTHHHRQRQVERVVDLVANFVADYAGRNVLIEPGGGLL